MGCKGDRAGHSDTPVDGELPECTRCPGCAPGVLCSIASKPNRLPANHPSGEVFGGRPAATLQPGPLVPQYLRGLLTSSDLGDARYCRATFCVVGAIDSRHPRLKQREE